MQQVKFPQCSWWWGALSVFLLIRYLLGLREEEPGIITVAPMLPHALRSNGASYKIAPLQWGKYALSVECIVRDAEKVTMRLSCSAKEGQSVRHWEWEGKWGEERRIELTKDAAKGPCLEAWGWIAARRRRH